MKIELGADAFENDAENEREKQELNQLWTIIIGCVSEGRKLVPVVNISPVSKK